MPITVDRSLGPSAAPEVRSLYETYDGWADRTQADWRRALAATDEIVALRDEESGDLVAVARILTDYTFYAKVYDVIVHGERRGNGLGEELLAAVVTHPPIADVSPTLAAREGLVSFYESCGFEAIETFDRPDGDPEAVHLMRYERETN